MMLQKKVVLGNSKTLVFTFKMSRFATGPQRQAHFEDVQVLFLPRLSGGREPCRIYSVYNSVYIYISLAIILDMP